MPAAPKAKRVKIPLLKFPILVAEEVLRNFDCKDLLEFSTLSARSSRLVRTSARNATPKVDIEISNDCAVKFYNGADDSDHNLLWCVGKPDMSGKPVALRSSRLAGTKRIEPKKVTRRQGIQEKLKYARKTNCCGTSLNEVLEHLFSIFPNLQVQDLVLNSLDQFNLRAGFASLHTVKNLLINCRILNDKAKFLMEKLAITDRYINKTGSNMASKIQDNIVCSQEIFSVNSAWMDPEKLSQINCAETHLFSTNITAKQVENYLLGWMNTDKYNNVQLLEVELRSDAKKINFERLGARAYDRQRRQPTITYKGMRLDCSQFLDIQKNDGSVGSMFVAENKRVIFLAWTELLKNGATL